jgi:hypothetical protein
MIEVYGFLLVFTLQLLAMSVLYPLRFNKYARAQATSIPGERLAKLFPGVDISLATERFLSRHRAVNTGIAVLGLLLLGWLFAYMRRPDWHEDPVILLSAAYFMVQYIPILFVTWLGFRWTREHKQSLLEGKRKATLERRGLFDFVSPVSAILAVVSYVFCVAFVLYQQQEPFPGFALIGVLTIVYVAQTVVVYRALYGKKSSPFETHASRAHRIGMTVKVCVYGCIVCALFFVFVFTVDQLDMKRWMPLAQGVCLLISTLFCLMGLTLPPRPPETDDLVTRDQSV